MLKKILFKLGNPLLFYTDKSGNSIFRNYNFLKNDGCMYKTKYTMPQVGKTLEFRFDLDKKLNFGLILDTIFVYLVFIQFRFSIISLILFLFIWIVLYLLMRHYCAVLFDKHLLQIFGSYQLTEFNPQLAKEKKNDYNKILWSKILFTIFMIIIFLFPALLIVIYMHNSILSQNPNYKRIVHFGNIYNHIYPKIALIYDISACAKYGLEDYSGALNDYITIFKMDGKKFSNNDFTRFANFLFLEKHLYGSQEAVDQYNDYTTRKKTSVLEQSQLVWIKSMFSIKNNISEAVIQDYEDLLLSLDSSDIKNKFYISCDKAYMLYLMGEYESAINMYNELIDIGEQNQYNDDLKNLYAERGFAKVRIRDVSGAKKDFEKSGYNNDEIYSHEPKEARQGFITYK